MTASFRLGSISAVLSQEGSVTRALADISGVGEPVLNFDGLTGPLALGDQVILNTLANELGLGSGGDSFVVWNLSREELRTGGIGHIMKLRYTPYQFSSLSVEEPESPYHSEMKKLTSLEGMPVVVGGLHSQLYAVVAAIKAKKPDANIVYLMTDGAALPIAYSRAVAELKGRGYLGAAITVGQAFGGDFEAVNIYSGLQAARNVAKADIAVVMMGPGIVGTDTALGFSAIEQGQVINAAGSLGGRPVAVLRLSFADARPRHRGISHQTLTALTVAALAPAVVALPRIAADKREFVMEQVKSAGLTDRHHLQEVDASEVAKWLEGAKHGVTTMGRGFDKEPEFFMAAGAAGISAAEMLPSKKI